MKRSGRTGGVRETGPDAFATRERGRHGKPLPPPINIYDHPLEEVIADVESEDEPVAQDSPVDFAEDEDFEAAAPEHPFERVLEASAIDPPHLRARLAIVSVGTNEFDVLVQGLGRPSAADLYFGSAQGHSLRAGLIQKAALLKTMGRQIINSCCVLIEAALAGKSLPATGPLAQDNLASEMARQGATQKTWATRISKIVREEAVELPDGRVCPLRHFFRTRGPKAEDGEDMQIVFLHGKEDWSNTDLAKTFIVLEKVYRPSGKEKKVDERYRKRFARLKDLLHKQAIELPDWEADDVAWLYLVDCGLAADDPELRQATTEIITYFRRTLRSQIS
jgi:hypothetical protein